MAIEYWKGDLLQGSFSLRLQDACDASKQNPYPIPTGAVVKVLFPGQSGTLALASDVAVPAEFGGGFEVMIVDADNGECSYTLIPSKGATMKPSESADDAQPVDVVVYDEDGAQLQTFEISLGIIVSVRANT